MYLLKTSSWLKEALTVTGTVWLDGVGVQSWRRWWKERGLAWAPRARAPVRRTICSKGEVLVVMCESKVWIQGVTLTAWLTILNWSESW